MLARQAPQLAVLTSIIARYLKVEDFFLLKIAQVRTKKLTLLFFDGKKVFIAATSALHTDGAIIEDAAIQVAIDNLPYLRAEAELNSS